MLKYPQWPSHYPSLSAQYFLSLDPAIIGSSMSSQPSNLKAKSLRDIYTGVDVWGRGSHGGGGFGCYKAINHIDPKFLGLSVALFGQGWTWESEQDKPGWTWEKWWDYERTMWLGPQKEGQEVPVPDAPRREGEPQCPHGKFEPLVSFFSQTPPPNPADLPFYTSFGVGVGRAWFVEGAKVFQTDDGWTDIDKQCSLGNMVWPRPILAWEGDERKYNVPDALSTLDLDDAWNGGNSLRLAVSGVGSDDDDAFFRCVWLPVQSLAVTPRLSYEAHVVYKVESNAHVDLDLGLSVKLLTSNIQHAMLINPVAVNDTELPGGWATLSIQFELPADHLNDVLVAIGLVIGFADEDPTEAYEFSVLLGQMTIFPTSNRGVSAQQPRLLWADFKSTPSADTSFSGLLTWEAAASYTPLTNITVTSPEDPNPVWILDASDKWSLVFLYFNIYVQTYTSDGILSAPETALFIGTTGLSGHAQTFFVDPKTLPPEITQAKGVRFLVQGVTNRGGVLKWTHCVFVDVRL
jgi:mannosyl-glycoprotein endo-beta-N-acetylglucosaminidase